MVEDFEALAGVAHEGPDLSAITAGEGVTHGEAAVQIPPGATITVELPGPACAANEWVRLDTLTTQPIGQQVRVFLSAARRGFERTAHLQPGKDTLAIPLSAAGRHLPRGEWPAKAVFRLSNTGDAGVIVDNLRLEPAAEAPDGAVLLDFGGGGQIVWPGFRHAGELNGRLAWSGENRLRYEAPGYPDPLTGDFLGPIPSHEQRDSLLLRTSGEGPVVCRLWLTHYGYSMSQPVEYAFRHDGKTLVHEKHSAREMLGPQGLLAGCDGEWTPAWFNERYAQHFASQVECQLEGGRSRADTYNVQVAALAMAPLSKRGELTAWVAACEKDLRRFRRQFVVGRRFEPVCNVQPTEAEQQAGVMLFDPPPEHAFSSRWVPEQASKTDSLTAVAVPGSTVTIPFAAVPLRDAPFIVPTLSVLRKTGPPMGVVAADGIETFFLRKVPDVQDGTALFQPWVLSRRADRTAERRIAHGAIVVRVPPDAPPGAYSGTLRVAVTGGAAQADVKIDVVGVRGQPIEPTWGATTDASVWDVYYGLANALPAAKREALTRDFRRHAMSFGLNALTLRVAAINRDDYSVHSGPVVEELKSYPLRMATGETLFSIGGAHRLLVGRMDIPPGSAVYERTLSRVVTETREVATKAGLANPLMYLGSEYYADDLRGILPAARVIRKAGGRPAVTPRASGLEDLDDAAFKVLMEPYVALILDANTARTPEQVKRFKELTGGKVYLRHIYPDRFNMGFYARSIGVDGCYVYGLFGASQMYNGWRMDGRAALALRPDGSVSPTLAFLRIRQGLQDYALLARGETLLDAAGEAKVAADELDEAITAVKALALKQWGTSFDRDALRNPRAPAGEVAAMRDDLMRAMASVTARMNGSAAADGDGNADHARE